MNSNNDYHTPSSDKQDEQYFSDYLQGNSSLSDIYQHTTTAEPSAALDKKILSAARKHCESKTTSHWWAKPASWAASAAIFSLAGLLTFNTWQAEKTSTEQDLSAAAPMSVTTPISAAAPLPAAINTTLDMKAEVKQKAFAQQKLQIRKKSTNDTRRAVYKSAPAPLLESMSGSSAATAPGADSYSQQNFRQNPQQIQQQIKNLLTEHKRDEARRLLLQLQTNYPDYPVDPVILQQLSP